jgi:DNA-binding MarR family transcriptional regulator
MDEATPELPADDPRAIVENCAFLAVRMASRQITQHYDAALASSGLKITQFSVLAAIAAQGEEATMSALAKSLAMDRTTLTRNLRPLEVRQLVRIARGADRRERRIGLTTPGHAALMRGMPLWQAAQAEVLAKLGTERWQTVKGGLQTMTEEL